MREDLLHFVWKHRKLVPTPIQTSKGENLKIEAIGQHNHRTGPDFFNAKLNIDGQLWAGNVEMHVKASDWYAHGHETDSNYDNVILHVVWEDDISVFRKDGSEIPTLELKNFIPKEILKNYRALLENSRTSFINCENDFKKIDALLLDNWLERLFFERLEEKSNLIFKLLEASQNDWEKVLFCLLMKNFGLNVNGDVFLELAKRLDFSIIRKVRNNIFELESLLFGTAGLLTDIVVADTYHANLKNEFEFLRHKFNITEIATAKPEFHGLRPNNFPTIRLSQIANLYHQNQNLFSKLLKCETIDACLHLFDVKASDYWNEHFTFGKLSKKSIKKLTANFIDLLIVNTVVPIKFCYAKHHGKTSDSELVALISNVKPEKNSIIKKFDAIGAKTINAMYSQSKLQLYNEYCSKNRCLQCAVGNQLLKRNA